MFRKVCKRGSCEGIAILSYVAQAVSAVLGRLRRTVAGAAAEPRRARSLHVTELRTATNFSKEV